jgi:hypothetical protein
MRHERQRERVIAWSLIDAAREALIAAFEDPAEQAS